MRLGWEAVWVAGALALGAGTTDWAQGQQETKTVAMAAAPDPAGSAEAAGGVAAAVQPVRAAPPAEEDPCRAAVVSQPSRPMWTAGAQPTQCGVMENDLGWHWIGVGGGVHQ